MGAAGFGKHPAELPASLARTSWTSHDIYLRRDFALPPGDYNNLQLTVSHDDDAEIYLNGVLAAHLPGFQHAYEFVPISPEALATLRPGKNLLAVHCHQDIRAQYVDVGIVRNSGREVGGFQSPTNSHCKPAETKVFVSEKPPFNPKV